MKIHVVRFSRIPLLALSVAGSVLITTEVRADGKLVPATVCQPLVEPNGSGFDDQVDAFDRISSIRYTTNGRVVNQSATRRLAVVCPIVRDNLKQPLNWIRVIYADNHLDPNLPSPDRHEVLECDVRVAAGLATSISDHEVCQTNTKKCPFDVPTGGGTGTGYFQFKELDNVGSADDANNPNFIYDFSHYTLVCKIPPRVGHNTFSWIAGIMIDEP